MRIFKYSKCRTYLRNVTKTKAANKRMESVYYIYIYISYSACPDITKM